jgi:uncharacterized membrane protein YkgB
MSVPTPTARRASVASTIQRVGRAVALTGVVLPLLLIGGLKFTQFEVEALKPLIGGALGSLIFLVTTSLLFVMPIWEPAAGGFPALSGAGQFLIKDVALLGISLTLMAESLAT